MMFSLFPPVFTAPANPESNAQSSLFWITMFNNPQSNGAVLAQEMREFSWKWTYLYTPALLAAIALTILFGVEGGVGGFLLLCVAFLATRLCPPLRRAMEFRGHEVEVQAMRLLYDVDEHEHRAREAATMHRGYDGIFKSWTPETLAVRLSTYQTSAAGYVQRRTKKLRAFDQYRLTNNF
jgi:hypothetical protein